jgi:hypothetical protein
MPVFTLERTPVSFAAPVSQSLVRVLRSPFRIPAWSVVALIALALGSGYLAGRRHPAHHYVSYFGYPMVLDTTTGKACYAAAPKATEATALQDAAVPADGQAALSQPALGQAALIQTSEGPTIPSCGQE